MSVGIYPFDVFSLLSPVAASSRGASPDKGAGPASPVKAGASEAHGPFTGNRDTATSQRERR